MTYENAKQKIEGDMLAQGFTQAKIDYMSCRDALEYCLHIPGMPIESLEALKVEHDIAVKALEAQWAEEDRARCAS